MALPRKAAINIDNSGILDPILRRVTDELIKQVRLLEELHSVAGEKNTGGDRTFRDNIKIILGTRGEIELYFDGTNLILNTRALGTGDFHLAGGILVADVGIEMDGNLWLDSTRTTQDTGIVENSTNVLRNVAGGSGGVDLTSGATSWAAVSDEMVKVLIEPVENATEKMRTLRTMVGRYEDDDEDTRRLFLIAQDVQKVFPEAVVESPINGDGSWMVLKLKYEKMIVPVVAMLKEMDERLLAVEAAVENMGT